jgi:MoaA/NifB/PqqE/SkfB family radical SAM enzyme
MSFKSLQQRTLPQLWNTFRTRYGRFTDPTCRHHPSDIMVFITTRCNLTCNTCPFMNQSPYSPVPDVPDISIDLYKEVIQHFNRASIVGLVGGEPLLHPSLSELIKIAANQKMTVNVSTNGTLLDETKCRELLDTPLGFLNISLDAPDEAEYQRLRGGTPELFRKILTHAELFSNLKQQQGSDISLWLSFVTDIQNLHRIPDFAAVAKSVGADLVFCQNILSYKTCELTSGKGSLKDTPEIRNALSALTLPDDIEVVLPPLVPLDDDCRCVHCKHPFTMLSIDGAGNLSPCCVIPPHPKYGNIAGNIDQWRSGRKIAAIRQDMINGVDAFDDICLDCWERFSMGQSHEGTA